MKTRILSMMAALFCLFSCTKHEILVSPETDSEYRLEILGLDDTKGTVSTVSLDLADLTKVSSRNVTAKLKKKSGTSWVNVSDGVSYSWSASSSDSDKFSGSGTSGQSCTISAKAKGSGTLTVSAALGGSTVATKGVPVSVSDSRALTWSSVTTPITSGISKTALLSSNFSGTVTITSNNGNFLVGLNSSTLSSSASASFSTTAAKTIYYKYTGSSNTTVTLTATMNGISGSTTVAVTGAASDGQLALWDDDGILRFRCTDNIDYELTANQVTGNGLYGNFHGCGELKNITLFNYYIYDYEEGSVYTKYESDNGIQVTLYACTEDAIYNGGVVLSECLTSTVTGQHMGEQDDCTDLALSGCDISFGKLFVGVKVTFSDGAEYWAKLDDTSLDGGKLLIQSDCYMVGLYNSSTVYTTVTSRKKIYYNTNRYDVNFVLSLYDGNVTYYCSTGCPYQMSFTDNYGHTYVIPANTVGSLVVDSFSKGDDIYDDGAVEASYDYSAEFMMAPSSAEWWYATTPSYDSGYIKTAETDSYIEYTKYVFDVDL